MPESTLNPGTVLDRLRRVRTLSRSLPAEHPVGDAKATASVDRANTESFFLGLDESPNISLDTTPHDQVKSQADLPRDHIIGPYKLLSVIGRGGMGIVFKADDQRLHRTVALKMLLNGGATDERIALRFITEAQALARLDHPHVVPVYDVNDWDGIPYFVMKYVPGGTLSDAAKRLRDEPKALVTVLAKVCRAVGYLHDRNVSHRDLKPLNILLSEANEPLVADFGLAKLHDSDSNLTVTHCLLGTRFYMAPEQTHGSQTHLTPACDIWSLGVVLYEMITGRLPFYAEHQSDLFRKICNDEPADVTWPDGKTDAPLNAVVRRALAKHPADRYPTATALAEDLERWLAGQRVLARSPAKKRTWNVAKWAAAALMVVGCGLALAWSLRSQETRVLIGATADGVVFDPFPGTSGIPGKDAFGRFTLESEQGVAIIQLAEANYPNGCVIEAMVRQLDSPNSRSYAGVYCRGTSVKPGVKTFRGAAVVIDVIESNKFKKSPALDANAGIYFHAEIWDPTVNAGTLNSFPIGAYIPKSRRPPNPTLKIGDAVHLRLELDASGTIAPMVDANKPMTQSSTPELIRAWKDTAALLELPIATPDHPGEGLGLIVDGCKAAFWNVTVRPR